jgi:acylphosphatase
MNKQEILTNSLEAREQEIMGYQINIDNYTLAIEHIKAGGDEDLADFCEKLEMLLESEKLEQKKAKVMYLVIQQQLNV